MPDQPDKPHQVRFPFLPADPPKPPDPARERRERIGAALRALRGEYSGEAIAAAVRMDWSNYYAVERGDRGISQARLAVAAQAIGVEPIELLRAAAVAGMPLILEPISAAHAECAAEIVTAWPELSEGRLAAIRVLLRQDPE